MRTLIDGQEVELNYLSFSEGDGQVVQIRIKSKGWLEHPLHEVLTHQFPRIFSGVMDNPKPNDDWFTEIRVLNATHLQVIDAIRFFGLGVTEVAPKPS